MRKFLLACTLFVAVILLSIAAYFTGVTLTDGRIVWAVFISVSLCIAIPTRIWWRRLTDSGKFIWNYLFGIVVIVALLSSVFYVSNYVFSNHSSKHSVTAVVVKKYSRKQAKRRTVGRRVIYTSDKTYTYHVILRFENGLEKEQPVAVKKYLKISVGDKMNYDVESGLFGIPVIKR